MQITGAPATPLPATTGTLTPIEQAVFESVAYSDIFDYPVTAAEIRRALTVEASIEEVEGVLGSERLVPALLTSRAPYYCLAGHEHVFETRERRRQHSTRLMRIGRAYGTLIGQLPFVRMVAITGSLAVDNAEADDDIDYLIVTTPGRVWTARAFTMLAVRLAALRGITLCPNYILSDDVLALDQHDLYTARELVQMQPIAGQEAYRRLLDANPWRTSFLPNARTAVDTPSSDLRVDADHSSGPGEESSADVERISGWRPGGYPLIRSSSTDRPWHQRAFEIILGTFVGERLERRIFDRKSAELRREAGANDEAVFDRTMCKGHFDRHRTRTTASLADRIRTAEEAPQ